MWKPPTLRARITRERGDVLVHVVDVTYHVHRVDFTVAGHIAGRFRAIPALRIEWRRRAPVIKTLVDVIDHFDHVYRVDGRIAGYVPERGGWAAAEAIAG